MGEAVSFASFNTELSLILYARKMKLDKCFQIFHQQFRTSSTDSAKARQAFTKYFWRNQHILQLK